MKQSKSKSRMVGSADAFLDQRLALGRVAFPLADLVKATGLSVTSPAFSRRIFEAAQQGNPTDAD
jgi:hypothetical protein